VKIYQQIPLINLLPEEYRWTPPSFLELLLIFLLLVEIGVGFLLYQRQAAIHAEVSRLEGRLASLEEAYHKLEPDLERATELQTQLNKLKEEQEGLKQSFSSLPQEIPWGRLTARLFDTLPEEITLSLATQNGNELVVEGFSASSGAVFNYCSQLRKLPEVSQAFLETLFAEEEAGGKRYSFSLRLQIGGPGETS